MTGSETNEKKPLTVGDVVKDKPLPGTPVVYPMLDFSMFDKPQELRDLYDKILSSRNAGGMLSQQRELNEFTKRTGLDPIAIHEEVERRKDADYRKSIGK